MKPLLFLTASDRKSGPNKQLCQTAMSLAKEGLDVTIFIFCRSKNPNDWSDSIHEGVKVIYGSYSKLFLLFALFKFFVLLKDYKKKPVINSCGFLPDFFTLLVKLPVISIVRSQILLEYKIKLTNIKKK